MEDAEEPSNDLPRNGQRWSTSDQLKAASILATLLVAILSLVLSSRTQGVVATVTAGRVEIGTLPSNSNAGDPSRPWKAWEEPVTPTTLYIGVKRRIQFKRPFETVPRVSTAFGLIDTYPVGERLSELGLVFPEGDPVVARLRDIHVLSFADSPDETGFILEVGIGLPTVAGEFLVSQLQSREPSMRIIEGMRRYGQLSGESASLTADERWLANFYTLVGSFNVTWTAQQ